MSYADSDRPSDIEEDNGWDGYVRSTYSGAPDECNIHWPTKLADGYCPIPDCPWSHARRPDGRGSQGD
jgi:hypothetical protein